MRTLIDFAILKEYERVKNRGDKLVEIGSMIEWEPFRVILDPLFKNKGENGGRPVFADSILTPLYKEKPIRF